MFSFWENHFPTDAPESVLTVSPSWLSPGDSVTLSCKVEHPSAGWRFYWYKTVPKLSDNSYSYELLPGSTNGTEQDSYIIRGSTHTARYMCRAGRGDPVFYTDYSKPEFVWSGGEFACLFLSPSVKKQLWCHYLGIDCGEPMTFLHQVKISVFQHTHQTQCWYWIILHTGLDWISFFTSSIDLKTLQHQKTDILGFYLSLKPNSAPLCNEYFYFGCLSSSYSQNSLLLLTQQAGQVWLNETLSSGQATYRHTKQSKSSNEKPEKSAGNKAGKWTKYRNSWKPEKTQTDERKTLTIQYQSKV